MNTLFNFVALALLCLFTGFFMMFGAQLCERAMSNKSREIFFFRMFGRFFAVWNREIYFGERLVSGMRITTKGFYFLGCSFYLYKCVKDEGCWDNKYDIAKEKLIHLVQSNELNGECLLKAEKLIKDNVDVPLWYFDNGIPVWLARHIENPPKE